MAGQMVIYQQEGSTWQMFNRPTEDEEFYHFAVINGQGKFIKCFLDMEEAKNLFELQIALYPDGNIALVQMAE